MSTSTSPPTMKTTVNTQTVHNPSSTSPTSPASPSSSTIPKENVSMQKDEVESPSTSNSNALARFEFEPGKSKDGTKILMVEWEEEETTRQLPGEWQVSWEGKSTVLPANDLPAGSENEKKNRNVRDSGDAESDNGVKRLYFLLPPGIAVPSIVTLTKHATTATTATAGATAAVAGTNSKSSSSSSSTLISTAPTPTKAIVWKTNPLPAIFPPELGASARAAGKKGVLHTIWAKKRLQSLQREIVAESSANAEGVGLQMAVQEKEWIESNFGVVARPVDLRILSVGGPGGGEKGSPGGSLASPISPSSPRSPGGGRLMEKLKGLKLSTSEKELTSPHDFNANDTIMDTSSSYTFNPLSPETSDVAVSSFSAIRGTSPSSQASTPSQAQQPLAAQLRPKSSTQQQHQQRKSQPLPSRKVASQVPPASLLAQQQRMNMASLDAFAGSSFDDKTASAGGVPVSMKSAKSTPDTLADDREDGLFALPISPRSPEMTKSPFSFASRDTGKYGLVGR